jgi:hypothetical protein
MFESGFNYVDVFHIALLVGSCIACYVAGKISGAANFCALLIDQKVLTMKDLDKLQEKLSKDED